MGNQVEVAAVVYSTHDDDKDEHDQDEKKDNCINVSSKNQLIQFFANSPNAMKQSNESILYRNKFGDRRQKIVTKEYKNHVIQCIGRIRTIWNDNENEKTVGVGSGTVFKVIECEHYHSICFVITCAHNVVMIENNTVLHPKTIYFDRIETFEEKNDEPKILSTYEIKRYVYNENYISKQSTNNNNDIAILIIL